MTDLLAWNTDATRIPSEYLRQLFLNNDFAEGRFRVDDRPVTFNDIQIPIFCVGTEWDHVAPWRSTYKLHLLSDAPEVTFLLTNGGHEAGIVSPPEHPRRQYRMATALDGDPYIDPDSWLERTQIQEGSWWPAWQRWLMKRSGPLIPTPDIGSKAYPPLEDTQAAI